MYVKFKWIRVVRGLTPIERNVLTYLSERADNDTGITKGIYSRTIAMKCETTQNNVFKVLRVLQNKGFLKSRTVRPGKYANSYALDLGSYRPKGENQGAAVWADVVKRMAAADGLPAERHAEQSDAYYNRKTKTLTVWFDSGTGLNFFKYEVKKVIKLCRTNKPKISLIELLPKVPNQELEN